MRIKVYCLAAMVASAVIGCMPTQIMKPSEGSSRQIACPGGTCDAITVFVKEIGTVQNPVCVVDSVSVPVASVTGQPAGEKTIKWALENGSQSLYEFSREEWKLGILIKPDGADPSGKFKQVTIPGQGKELSIKFDHRAQPDANGYAYGLTVRRSSDMKFCQPLDPWLVG